MYACAQSALAAVRIISILYQKAGAHPLETRPATDEMLDDIASIEMQRRKKEKEAGLAASCNFALRRLHERLDHEKEALQLRGPDAGHPGNVEAVMIESQRKASWRNAQRTPARNKGRRTMGRAGGR